VPVVRRLVVSFVIALALASPALAQERPRPAAEASDLWTELGPGIRFLDRRTTVPTHLHAIVVDRRASAASVAVTPYDDRWATVSEHAARLPPGRVVAVTNGGFWTTFQTPLGITAGGGVLWPSSAPDPIASTFWIDREGAPHISGPETVWDEAGLAEIAEAVGGRPMLVTDGAVALAELDPFPTANDRAPRTAIGIGAGGRTLILVVVDGRQPSSRGMTLYELSRLMIELGAERALNLDGGGCSEMVVPRLGGIVNVPARGRWEIALDAALGDLSPLERVRESEDGSTELWVHGTERTVMSHLAIMTPEPPDAALDGIDGELVPGIEPPAPVPAPRPAHPFRTLREHLAPLLWLGVPTLMAVVVLRLLLALVRWVRRRSGSGPVLRQA
jgi:hypothetical protein